MTAKRGTRASLTALLDISFLNPAANMLPTSWYWRLGSVC